MLISLLTLSLTAFSQTGTDNQVKCFPVPVVKQIMKDLLSGDEAKLQLKLSDSLLRMTENKVIIQDSIISDMKLKEENYQKELKLAQDKLVITEEYNHQLEKDLKKQKVKNKFTSILSGTAVVVLTTLYIIK